MDTELNKTDGLEGVKGHWRRVTPMGRLGDEGELVSLKPSNPPFP